MLRSPISITSHLYRRKFQGKLLLFCVPTLFQHFAPVSSTALEHSMRITTPQSVINNSNTTGEQQQHYDASSNNLWREQWDSKHDRPYFRNLATNQIQFTVPEGVSSNSLFYRKKKRNDKLSSIPDYDDVASRSSNKVAVTSPSTTTPEKKITTLSATKRMKQQVKEMGLAGIVLLTVIEIVSYAFVVVVILAGVDFTALIDKIGIIDIKSRLGENGYRSFWAVVIVAEAVNSMLFPAHVVATVMLAPSSIPYLKRGLLRYGFKA